MLPVRARWSIFAYAWPSFVGLTGISQLALNRFKLAVIVIPFQLHPFGGESFSGFFHSRRIEQRPLTRLEHPPRGRTVSAALCAYAVRHEAKEKPRCGSNTVRLSGRTPKKSVIAFDLRTDGTIRFPVRLASTFFKFPPCSCASTHKTPPRAN